MFVVVEQAGLSQLVDDGRCGYGQYGLAGGQPVDMEAARSAMALLSSRAAKRPWWIEIGPTACRLRVTAPLMVALGGATRSIEYGGQRANEHGDERAESLGRHSQIALRLEEGQWLRAGAAEDGFYSYVCFGAELELQDILGSLGASLVGDFPGIQGRRLANGDRISVEPTVVPIRTRVRTSVSVASVQQAYRDGSPASDSLLRFVPGPDYDALLSAEPWAIDPGAWMTSAAVDRRAIRLQATVSAAAPNLPVIDSAARSVPTVQGLIQWPNGGWPLILGPDRQTIGGYPRFGYIITADLPILGRLRPGKSVTLVPVSRQEARSVYNTSQQQVRKWLHWIQTANER